MWTSTAHTHTHVAHTERVTTGVWSLSTLQMAGTTCCQQDSAAELKLHHNKARLQLHCQRQS